MSGLPELWSNIQLGFDTAFSLQNVLYCFFGVSIGTFLGIIPGIGALAALSMLFPITYQITDPAGALIMLAGIYYGTSYGGSTASILLNVPGTPSAAVVCLDGHPMARQGRAGVALFMGAIASFVGASLGIVIMMLLTPVIAEYALSFGSPEYFSLVILGLLASAAIARGSLLNGLAMVALGMAISCIGTDIYTGRRRFDFGLIELYDGVALVALAIGLFGVSEVMASARATHTAPVRHKITFRSMYPSRDDLRRSWAPMLRGTGIGAFFGALPGTGSLISSLVSYGVEKNVSREPERFGTGAIEGVVAPEAANNATDPTSFIPTLTLGIPGSAAMALMIGVLMIHGINPGPRLIETHPDLFWGLVASFWIGNVMLLVLNIPLIRLWVALLNIPYRFMYPAIVIFICLGVYSVNNSTFDIFMVAAFGVAGYLFRLLGFPVAPLVLGFILGPLIEEHFRRSMLMSGGDFTIFLERPISSAILTVTCLVVMWSALGGYRRRARSARAPS